MGKVFLALAALAAIWLLPAEAHADDGDAVADEPDAREPGVAEAPAGFDVLEGEPGYAPVYGGFGIREHDLRVVPRGTPQVNVDRPYRREAPAWPGDHLKEAYQFADAYSFPELFPKLGSSYGLQLGAPNGDSNPVVFSHRVDLELYVLHVGLSLYDAADDTHLGQQIVDLDARIPLHLAEHMWLSFFPGFSFDAARVREDSEVRVQSVVGWGWDLGSVEARLGYTEGPRPGGVLLPDGIATVAAPAGLFGALAAIRPLRALELRAEVSGEISGTETDLLSLLPGVAYYPLEDERVVIGAVAVIESRQDGLGLSDAHAGALFRLALNVY